MNRLNEALLVEEVLTCSKHQKAFAPYHDDEQWLCGNWPRSNLGAG